jgi:hypothetical protein
VELHAGEAFLPEFLLHLTPRNMPLSAAPPILVLSQARNFFVQFQTLIYLVTMASTVIKS